MARAGTPIVAALDSVRIGRVHQHHTRSNAGLEQFVDQFAIVAGHRLTREHGCEAFTAQRRDFVERKPRSRLRSPDREHSGSGRWFEQKFAGKNCARPRGEPGDPRRGGELLPLDLLVAAGGLAGHLRLEPAKGAIRLTGRHSAGQRGRLLQKQHLGEFKCGMGIAHRPVSLGIASAEVFAHDRIEDAARHDLAGA